MKAVRLVRMTRRPADRQLLQRVLEEAPEYAMKVTGAPPNPHAADSLLAELPEGKTYEDKFVFCLQLSNHMVGCADVLRGFPVPEKAFLGLLLIGEPWQGRGLGAAAYAELEALVRSWGCRTIRLAVVQANGHVLGFWKKLGFEETGERVEYSAGSVQSELVLMEKLVVSAAV